MQNRQPRPRRLREWIENQRDAILGGGEAGPELASFLLRPFREVLADLRSLVIVPHLDLYRVPFASLRFEGATLGERIAVEYAPTLFGGGVERRRSPTTSLSVVDPDTQGRFSPLPAARAEGIELSRRSKRALLLSGARADKMAVLEAFGSAGTIHIGAHAVVNERRPALSSLALAGADHPSSYLPAWEIAALDLRHVGLVVLATCDSATTETGFSLARAFLHAGAERVVGSILPIPDMGNSSLAFHAGVARDRAPGRSPSPAWQVFRRSAFPFPDVSRDLSISQEEG